MGETEDISFRGGLLGILPLRIIPGLRLMARWGAWLGLAATLGSGLARAASTDSEHGHLWQAYAGRFISGDGRVVDPQGADHTTSEGQSYAMFFALVNNDRAHFDKVLSWTVGNLAQGDLGAHLPAWNWGKGKDGGWHVLDPNSASDSDLWIAYDLIEAGRLWNNLSYADTGRRLAALIAKREVANLPGLGPVMLPAPVGFAYQRFWVLNPSYMPVFLLDRMAAVDPAGPWADVAAVVPSILERSERGGFAMDWTCYTPGEGFTPCLANGKKEPAPVGSYDAIRVYAWAGMLADSNATKPRMLKALYGMNNYSQQHSAPPEKVSLDGFPQAQDGPIGFSAALLPFFESNSNTAAGAQQMVRIKSQLHENSGLYGPGETYYDQNLVLFGTGWMEKRFEFGSSGELLVRWSR